MILIKGESGSGKTLFARQLIEMISKEEKKSTDFPKWKDMENVHILASSISAYSEKLFLNAWIPIL